jgi:hypothetical protein
LVYIFRYSYHLSSNFFFQLASTVLTDLGLP